MALFDLNQCDQDCFNCIKSYKKKHRLSGNEESPFKINCSGIPKEYISKDLYQILPAEQIKTAEIMLNPVAWAREVLDWHCLDPDGEVWKRRNSTECYNWTKNHPGQELLGHSRYHRPYQAEILSCTSKRKVLRMGRQLGKSEVLVIAMLFHLFTKPGVAENEGFRIVVIAPYQSQIDLIFNRMDELLRTNPATQNSIISRTKSPPCKLVLNNHSQVIGFTAGTKSGGNADSVRGQKANMLVLDEADYLNPNDLDSALSIITNFPDASLWMSSTPRGTRDKFYNACHSRLYKEFHYPSFENPLWGPELEATFREQLTEIGYKHEICLAKGTKIKTLDGIKNIEDIESVDKLFDHRGNIINVVSESRKTGVKAVVSANLPGGLTVKATPDHGFPDRLFKKRRLDLLSELPIYRDSEYSSYDRLLILARIVGYNLGDGTCNPNRYQSSFYSGHKPDMDRLRDDVKRLWPEYKGKVVEDLVRSSQIESSLVNIDGMRYTVNVSVNATKELLRYGVVRGKKVEQEFRVPEFVREVREWTRVRNPKPIYTLGNEVYSPDFGWVIDKLSFDIKAEFLAALFGAEGSTPRDSNGFMPSTVCLSMDKRLGVDGSQFFSELVALLRELGIRSTWTSHIKGENTNYSLYVYSDTDNIRRFFDVVGYRYAEEKEELAFYWKCYLDCWQQKLREKQGNFIEARRLRRDGHSFKQITETTGLTFSQVDKAVNRNDTPKRLKQEFCRFREWLDSQVVDKTVFMPIIELYYHKSEYETYNLTVDSDDHSYVLANGIRTFNCADFGEQEEGVFQNMYVDAAQAEYEYGQKPRDPNWRYMIGVDWNDVKIGTSIVVVGYDPGMRRFFMVDKQRVSRDGWNLTAACQKIIQMNRFWQPEYIYVDSGGPAGGGAQIEELHRHGWEALHTKGAGDPDARLRTIVKPYAFGGSIEIHDLITKQPIKKPAKPFLVENTVRKFEHNIFFYPKSDELFTRQLLGYIVDHTTVAGLPVYKASDETVGDHDLDAAMLAMVAFTLETTDYGKPKFSIDFAFSGKMGEKAGPPKEGIPGFIVAKNTIKKDPRENNRPALDRSKEMEDKQKPLLSGSTSIPAAKTTRDEGGLKIWSWPGWESDAPKPKSQSSLRRTANGVSVRSTKPKRKNI